MSHVRRLFPRRLLIAILLLAGFAQAETPAKTVVADVVYRADGSPASGQALISWPAFTAADGSTVAAGTTSVTLGPGGTFSVELVPNAGATPAGMVYTVVFQLGDSVRTEYWSVGTTSPTTIAAVRTTLGASATTSQMATRQYVDNAVAGRANDTSVVHVSGSETISGVKEFSLSPEVPDPISPSEGLFGNRSGADKKQAALSFVEAALSMGEAVAAKDIVDNDKFQDGLSKVIDGTVQCLNASIWAKAK